jgi:hypothetical protein
MSYVISFSKFFHKLYRCAGADDLPLLYEITEAMNEFKTKYMK